MCGRPFLLCFLFVADEVREKTVGEGVKGKMQREQGSSKMNMEL